MEISETVQKIIPSAIRKMFNKALEYEDVISFALGEPDFTASDNVMKAGCRAISEGKTKYTANAGIIPLREAISNSFKEKEDLIYDPLTEITITVGGMGALYLSLKTLLNPGDEVIICEPYWTNYIQQVKMCNAVPVLVNCREENDFMIDIQDLENAITKKTKILILNTPSNPTGSVLDHNTLEGISYIVKKHDLIVISDEVYKTIVFDGVHHETIAALDGMQERTIIVDSFSKGYAMTGWRVGYAAGPKMVIENVTKLQENVVACASAPAQYAALEALTGSQDFNKHMVEQYKQRRDYIVERINKIPGLSCKAPKGTFYAFVNIKGLNMKSEEFAYTLLDKKQVVVIPGTAFGEGSEGYIRISYATSRELIEKGLDRIENFIK